MATREKPSTAFQPGHKKVGGRQKGGLNKVTKEHKSRIDAFFDATWDEFMNEIWPRLSPRDKKDTIIALMNYRYPKLSSVDVRSTVKQEESAVGMLAVHVGDAALVKK